MGTSAFEILIVPVLWATLGTFLAGAVIRVLIKAVAAVVGRLGHTVRSFKTVLGAARDFLRRAQRPASRGVGSVRYGLGP